MNRQILYNGKEIKDMSDLPKHVKGFLENGESMPNFGGNPLSILSKLNHLKNLNTTGSFFDQVQSLNQHPEKYKITFNNKTYNDIAEMPENERQALKASINQQKKVLKSVKDHADNRSSMQQSRLTGLRNAPMAQDSASTLRTVVAIIAIIYLIKWMLVGM